MMITKPLVCPESPVDTSMFPPIYGTPMKETKVNTFSISADFPTNKPVPKSECVVYDSEIEPFEYKPSVTGIPEDSLSSVFGDADLINSIMTSLETEASTAPAVSPVLLPPTPVISSYPCLRKPGTFLNKDGRWIKGKPCRISNCDKRAQSNGLCKGHGGGARCNVEGCSKSSQGGGLCRAHGGGKRCLHEGCEKGTQRNGFCYLHGGVRSCNVEGCDRKDRGNGKCFAHGGGRRCQAAYCSTTIRKGSFCAKHDSGKP
ncbi:hypothetical protein Poli38472_010469 [Pythium oligandrum]|uniref:WRKY19-like zinc finger domain-containing protein n=1 Tax=Pythium oligandrum TaxID=41045 RepID=A0A8K1C3R4_PYTOL|nr:hypothetical protein Poli38472_010469 [Pythium oligandrum]|eukprot:TMW55587.1 hypothetical protein Poli38472_010469 [Pythium oligandrum]